MRRPWNLEEEYTRFKATELRQLALYTGMVLFRKFLDGDAYGNFLKFSMAYRMLARYDYKDNVNTTPGVR